MSSVAQPGNVATASCTARPRTRAGTVASDSLPSDDRVDTASRRASTWTISSTRGASRTMTSSGSADSTVTETDVTLPGAASARIVKRPGATCGSTNRPLESLVAWRIVAPRGSVSATAIPPTGVSSLSTTTPRISADCRCAIPGSAVTVNRASAVEARSARTRGDSTWVAPPEGPSFASGSSGRTPEIDRHDGRAEKRGPQHAVVVDVGDADVV